VKLLVTGGSGFLGGHVLAEAARRGHSCVALARSAEAARTVAVRGATPLAGDLGDDVEALAAVFARARCDALVNLASLGFGDGPAIVGAAAGSGLDRAVFVSTTAVTTTLKARTKAVRLATEETIRSSGLNWTILRPTMIYGTADDRNLSRLLVLLARLGRLSRLGQIPVPGGGQGRGVGLPLVLPVPGGGRRLQQPVHVADVAGAVLAAVERPETAGHRYEVAGPSPLTFAELLRLSAAAVNCRVHLVPVPLAPVIAATGWYERLSRHPRIRVEQWQRLAEDKAFPIDAAVRDLAYAPRSFADGIRAEAVALGLAPVPAVPLSPVPASPGPSSPTLIGDTMFSLAKSPLAPVLGQRVPLRGPARLLFNSYAKTRYQPKGSVTRVTTVAGDTFDADLSSTLEWQLWAFGSYEKHFGELFSHLVRPGDRCVDVGANVGVHTVRLARLAGADGEVIAIEPDPDLVLRGSRNMSLNAVANVRVVNAAAGERAGRMRLYRPSPLDTNRARASLMHHPYLTGAVTTVPVVTVDSVCAGAPVALIKIDVEGHEAAVVRGAADTIARHAPSVVFEYAPELLDDVAAQAPFGWLAERGYEIYRIRCARHVLTGRGRLVLERLLELPAVGGDLLAVSGAPAARVRAIAG